jgi:hypothetical protein
MAKALAAARAIRDERARAEALTGLSPKLAAMPFSALYPFWQETLSFLAARIRRDVLSDLTALAPLLSALGGEEVIAQTVRAVQDVGRWWP